MGGGVMTSEQALRTAVARELKCSLSLPDDAPDHIVLDTLSGQSMLLEAHWCRLIITVHAALPLGPLRKFFNPSSETVRAARLHLNDT